MTGKLADRVAVITGGASGIGAATARRFAEEGARVALVDQDEALLKTTADAIAAAGGTVMTWPSDVTQKAGADDGIARVLATWRQIDIVVTAAGISTGGTVPTIDEATWDRVFATNVKGTYLWLHAALPSMIERQRGAVVMIASQLAVSSGGNNAAYIASKGAIVSLTRTMAVDHAPHGIRVNALAPGVIDTPMPRRSIQRYADPDATRKRWMQRHPLGRFGRPEEVANGALYLASDDSSFTTGSLLFIDSGWTAM